MRIFFFSLVAVLVACFALAEVSSVVKKIEVRGNKRTDTATVIEYLEFGVGDEYTQAKADTSIRALYAQEFFSNISISFRAGTAVVAVEENPIINEIHFQGNENLKDDALLAEISMRSRDYYSKAKLQNDVNKIKDLYIKSGRFSAKVRPKIAKLDHNRVDVLFDISESQKFTIKKIVFVGNTHFSSNELKYAIITKEDRIYNLFRPNYYDPDLVEYDKVVLSRFYTSHGYANFKVLSAIANILPSRDGFVLTFSVEEGKKYSYGKVSVKNHIPHIKSEDLNKIISFSEGNVFSSKEVDDVMANMIQYLANNGFPFVKIEPVYVFNNKTQKIDVTFEVFKTRKIYINRINISGNLKTYDSVIRKEMRISEGDSYNEFLVSRSQERLGGLDFFQKVVIKKRNTNHEDQVDLDVNVEEKSTASLNFSAGYSTTDGPLASIAFTEKNFLGQGQYVGAQVRKSPNTFGMGASFIQPSFMSKPVDVGVSADHESSENRDKFGVHATTIPYSKMVGTSGSVFADYEILDKLSHQIGYSILNQHNTPFLNAPLVVRQQTAHNINSSVFHKLKYDATDNFTKTTRGHIVAFTQSYAGVGGDSKYIKHILEGNWFYSIIEDVVLKIGGSVGDIRGVSGSNVRIDEHYHLGGYTLRGFETAGIGPRDKTTLSSLGGTTYYTGTVELRFPVPGIPKDLDIHASVFSDVGSLFNVDLPKNTQYTKSQFYSEKKLRASVGVGLLWYSTMGPLRFDLARAVKKQTYDKTQVFLVSYSTAL